MIAIVDYGCGNLFSLQSSLRYLGFDPTVTDDPAALRQADRILLPGVGAFGDAVKRLTQTGLSDAVKEQAKQGTPILGICLGMQLLFEKSYEYGEHTGLGLIEGEVCPLKADLNKNLKIPHMGWNALRLRRPDDPLLRYVKDGDYVYFVHSFYAKHCAEALVADAEYDVSVPALVRNQNVHGAQFHPEKSGDVGLGILRAFCEAD